ncbi:unnamed protein product [Adineta steineri]|uniref:Uncharacterized protein n=1 Tax=Adineta steineri TaxID=433720 RepID=A0A815Q7E9_9BILA|nr:unnamed protein product [Adineta steineri]CAF4069609.1 unnamed protein product [Adineta steineri]
METFTINHHSTATNSEENYASQIAVQTSANDDETELYISTNEDEPRYEELVLSTIPTENFSINDYSAATQNEENDDSYIVTDTGTNDDGIEAYRNTNANGLTYEELVSSTIPTEHFSINDYSAANQNEENDDSYIVTDTGTNEDGTEAYGNTNANGLIYEELVSSTIPTETFSIHDYSAATQNEENDDSYIVTDTGTNEDGTEAYANINDDEFEEEELASSTVLTETSKINDILESVISRMLFWDEPICHDDVCCCNSLCKRPVQKRRPESNGCGPKKFFLSGFIKLVGNFFEFTRACNTHDNCYGTCGKLRTSCDEAFLSDMISSCDENSGNWFSRQFCQLTAKTFNAAVRRFGRDPFLHAQMDNCLCLTIGVRRDIN